MQNHMQEAGHEYSLTLLGTEPSRNARRNIKLRGITDNFEIESFNNTLKAVKQSFLRYNKIDWTWKFSYIVTRHLLYIWSSDHKRD